MNYYDWMDGNVTCPHCGWQGLGKETSLGETFDEYAERECPQCHGYLGAVAYPTLQEVRSDPRADPADRKVAEFRAERTLAFEITKLVSPDQLPDLDPIPESLTWDVTEGPTLQSEVVILCGEREIWREMSWYENYRRFGEVASLLHKKYGPTLKDLVPSGRSRLALYGDRLDSLGYVERVRELLSHGINV